MDEHLVVIVAYDGVEALDITCVRTPLTLSKAVGADPPYKVVLATPGGAWIECDCGMEIRGQAVLERLKGPIDTLVVAGGLGHERAAADPLIVGHVRRLALESKREASVCTGATVLAATGLLDGKTVATHWKFAATLQKLHPKIKVDPAPVYIIDVDNKFASSAGITCGLDLTLRLIEDDHGADVSRRVAQATVVYHQRPGNQKQMSMHMTLPVPQSPRIRRVVEFIGVNLAGDLSDPTLERVAGLGERQLQRRFKSEMDMTPAVYVRQARAQEAASMLVEQPSLPLDGVARRCGFPSAAALRRVFREVYSTSPSQYRERQLTAHRTDRITR